MSDKETKVCFTIFCIMVLLWASGMLLAVFDVSTFYSGLLITFAIFGMWFMAEYVHKRRKRNRS